MGLEDSVILADRLVRNGAGASERAFDEFADRRRARTGRILGISRANAEMLAFDTPELARARNGRWRGMRTLDPEGLDFWRWMWSYDVDAEIAAMQDPGAELVMDEGSSEHRRANALWAGAIEPADRARGWTGERVGYERFWAGQAPVDDAVELQSTELGGIGALVVRPPGGGAVPAVLHLHGAEQRAFERAASVLDLRRAGLRFEEDRSVLADVFPRVRHVVFMDGSGAVAEGEVDVDIGAGCFEPVEIRMVFDGDYPTRPPRVFDRAGRWQPKLDRHLYSNGEFCLWLDRVDVPT
jgi:hypothetical protein